VIVAVPAETPVKTPVPDPITATLVLLLTHVPPDVAFVRIAEAPAQTDAAPVMAGGKVLTVIVVLVAHPLGNI
jgi:hypothetical protein